MFSYSREDLGLILIKVPAGSVEPWSQSVLDAWIGLVDRLQAEVDVRLVLMVQDQDASPTNSEDCSELGPGLLFERLSQFLAALNRFEQLSVPTVFGFCGGESAFALALAFACSHRLGFGPLESLSLSFQGVWPSVPGLGQRLMRMVGIHRAAEVLVYGQTLSADQLVALGLVQEVLPDWDSLCRAASSWSATVADPRRPWNREGYQWPGGEPQSMAVTLGWSLAPAVLRQKCGGVTRQQKDQLAALYEGSLVGMETACRIESRYLIHSLS